MTRHGCLVWQWVKNTTIPGTQWDDPPVCDGAPAFTAYPCANGDLLVEAVDTCNHGEKPFEEMHAVIVRDGEGTLLNSFGVSTTVGGVRELARLSLDGELIALPVDFGEDYTSIYPYPTLKLSNT